MVDFAANCLDEDIKVMLDSQRDVLRFVEADLTEPMPDGLKACYGVCCDVMEHIQPDTVDAVLTNILSAAQHVYFQIATEPDQFGAAIGETLHVCVRPFDWWKERIESAGAVISHSKDEGGYAKFYATAWADGKDFIAQGELNCELETYRTNIRASIRRGLQQIRPYDLQDVTVMLLGGGPSLSEFESEIREKREAGQFLITTNGSYNWCLDRGINPSATVVVDAQPHNARFVQPVIDNCKYLIASQCDASVFDAIPPEAVWLWHAIGVPEVIEDLTDFYKDEPWDAVPGGSTVVLRSLLLLRILGFAKFEIYGFDSCVLPDAHHAYSQSENDGEITAGVMTQDGKTFRCTGWQISQAQEFLDQMKSFGNEIEIDVKGNGLIAHLLEVGADMQTFEDERESEAIAARKTCSCDKCRSACEKKPGCFLPGEVEKVADYLKRPYYNLPLMYQDRIAFDGSDTTVVSPQVVDESGDPLPDHIQSGRCAFLKDGACSIHSVKPFECREYWHGETNDDIDERHLKVIDAWREFWEAGKKFHAEP